MENRQITSGDFGGSSPVHTWTLACLIILIGVFLRVGGMANSTLWVDEAESSINGLTILDEGLPKSEYLGLPIYENTLTVPWEAHPEYEFKDSSYSSKGVTVYHGWLPLYAIAASQFLFGLEPDHTVDAVAPVHAIDAIGYRTIAVRLPSVLFATLSMVVVLLVARGAVGMPAALASVLWLALSERAVWLGYQARYYALTMLMSALAVWCLWRLWRKADWPSHIWFGLVIGLLFHTHQLSALVFATASLVTAPSLMARRGWFPKAATAVLLAGVLTIPWAVLAGFFESATEVPKVYHLFDGWKNWMEYLFDRPVAFVIMLFAIGLQLIVRLSPRWIPDEARMIMRRHTPLYGFLVFWILTIYVAFHTLVPAASYFTNRLTLMLVIPYALLLGLISADIALLIARRYATWLALALGLVLFLVPHRTAPFYTSAMDWEKSKVAAVSKALSEADYPQGTRFFAKPNNQFIHTFYTGLPFQSTAPVRKRFYDLPDVGIVIVDRRHVQFLIEEERVDAVAAAHGETLSADDRFAIQSAIWHRMVAEKFEALGLPVPAAEPPLPDYAAELVELAEQRWSEVKANMERIVKKAPIYRAVEVEYPGELWDAFFVRFVDYENRIGTRAPYFERIQQAEVTFVHKALSVIFHCPAQVQSKIMP